MDAAIPQEPPVFNPVLGDETMMTLMHENPEDPEVDQT